MGAASSHPDTGGADSSFLHDRAIVPAPDPVALGTAANSSGEVVGIPSGNPPAANQDEVFGIPVGNPAGANRDIIVSGTPARNPAAASNQDEVVGIGTSTSVNCSAAESFSQKEKTRDIQGSEHPREALENIPSFDFVWTIKGFSLLPKLGRHFSETFDAMGLKWGLFLVPWHRLAWGSCPTLTLYLEDGSRDCAESGDLVVYYRITMFNQGFGDDKEYRRIVAEIFARRLICEWESTELVTSDVFRDPSYGFLVDDTCVFGLEILAVAPVQRRALPASDGDPRRFTWAIRGLSTKQKVKPYLYKKFSACGYDWIVCVLIGGPQQETETSGSGSLQIYLSLSSPANTLCQLFGRYRIRLVNQLTGNHIDKSYCSVFHSGELHGCAGVVPLRTFYDQEEGFLVQDCCIVEVEVTVLAKKPFRGRGGASYAAEHNPFEWDMSPYWSLFQKDPGFDITDLLYRR